jgi:hypothetical protein
MELQTPTTEPKFELDDEDTECLLEDCRNYLAVMLDRRLPKQLQGEGQKLLLRLDDVLHWSTLH